MLSFLHENMPSILSTMCIAETFTYDTKIENDAVDQVHQNLNFKNLQEFTFRLHLIMDSYYIPAATYTDFYDFFQENAGIVITDIWSFLLHIQ
jgi:hypothetical protein